MAQHGGMLVSPYDVRELNIKCGYSAVVQNRISDVRVWNKYLLRVGKVAKELFKSKRTMKVISEISLRDFKFWSGGEDRAKNCTDEQLDKIESIMESDAPESGWTDDDINNFFWFDFDTIADWLGYKDEKHFDAGVREDDVKEAQDWFDGITDTEDMINT